MSDKLGPTHDFPRGKLNEDDEGGLIIGLRIENNRLIIGFGKRISWIGLGKPEAIQFAKMIIEKADLLSDSGE
jgi:hypothetical protein